MAAGRDSVHVTESPGAVEIDSPMPSSRRVWIFAAGLVPLLAPYELLVRPRWHGYANVFFLFALLVSLGALAVTGICLWAAIAGLASRMRFDRAAGLFTYTASAPAIGTRRTVRPLRDVTGIHVDTHEWSDGPPSYSLRVAFADGAAFTTGSWESRAEIDAARERALAGLRSPPPAIV